MQVPATSAPKAAAAPVDIVAQVRRQADIMADTSTASDSDKVQAYVRVFKLLQTSGTAWYAQATQAERQAVGDIRDNSMIAKRIATAANEFNAFSLSQDMKANVPRINLKHLNGLPELEQQMIFAGTVPDSFASLADWKSQIERDIVAVDKMYADDKAARGEGDEDSVTLSDDAKAALEALLHPGPGDVMAAAALKLLQNAAEARAKAKAAETEGPSEGEVAEAATPAAKSSVAGEALDTVA